MSCDVLHKSYGIARDVQDVDQRSYDVVEIRLRRREDVAQRLADVVRCLRRSHDVVQISYAA